MWACKAKKDPKDTPKEPKAEEAGEKAENPPAEPTSPANQATGGTEKNTEETHFLFDSKFMFPEHCRSLQGQMDRVIREEYDAGAPPTL